MDVELLIPGTPVPLERSRTNRGHHYLPKRSQVYRELVQAEWMAAGRPTVGASLFAMSAQFYGANPRADIDNLIKALCDSLNGLAFSDDSQLVCLAGCHKLPKDRDGSRVRLALWRVPVSVYS